MISDTWVVMITYVFLFVIIFFGVGILYVLFLLYDRLKEVSDE